MSTIAMILTLWMRICSQLGLCFDLSGIALDDEELEQQLGYGRE